MSLTLEQLQGEAWEWVQHNFPNGQPYQPLLGAMEELGELCHAHLKMEQGIREADNEDKWDAVGDIVVYLADYCNRNGIDLAKAVEMVWESVKFRDWIKYPKNGRTE